MMPLGRCAYRRALFGSFLVPAAYSLSLSGCHPAPHIPSESGAGTAIRAIWVTRWDYHSAHDIRTIMANCQRAGFNNVLFQVRGNGTAFYRSGIEPWADELGGKDPGFDPLAVACRQAHRLGLKLHAWVNVMPGWRGREPPSNPKQLYRAKPEWFWRDAEGRRQPLGWYDSLNPCYPEVRGYLVSVMKEIVKNYDLDGLHLDYLRFPNEWNESYPSGVAVPDYPRDPRTLALFKHDTGQTPTSSPRQWIAWRADQVTRLLRDIHDMVQAAKPRVMLSAAVGADPKKSYLLHYQDSLRWIREGLLSAVFPMNYTDNTRVFERRVDAWTARPSFVRVVMGIQTDQRQGRLVVEQIRRSRRRTPDFSLFAYHSLFERLDENRRPVMDRQSPLRTALRRDALPFVRSVARRGL